MEGGVWREGPWCVISRSKRMKANEVGIGTDGGCKFVHGGTGETRFDFESNRTQNSLANDGEYVCHIRT